MVDGKAMARRKGDKCKVSMAVRGVQGLPWTIDERVTAAVEVRWQGGRHGYGLMFPFLAGRKRRVARSRRKPVECGGRVEWGSGEEEEAARLENVSVSVTGIGIERGDSGGGSESDSLHDVSFSVLLGFHGQEESNELKAEVIGTATVSLAELARGYLSSSKEMHEATEKESILDGQIKQIPITLKSGSMTYNAILEVDLRVVEVPSSKSSKVAPTNRDEKPTAATNIMHRQSSSCTEFVGPQELLGSSDNLNSSRRRRSFGGSTSYEVGIFCSSNLLSWRKNSKDLAVNKNNMVGGNMKNSKKQKGLDEDPIGNWEKKEFTCREAQTKLKTDVFFASIDQRDESAGGESACTALVVVFAHALLCNNLTVPTKQDLDMLIRDGSSEWRKLCADTALIDHFPNRHFDLETVASANVRPVMVLDEKSFIGFFQPESFTSLSGAKSFDEIWNEIMSNVQDGEAHVYIVSWNDHFFVLKVDVDACYIIDTLGERLFEGCNKAYMLKFDESSEMHTLPDKSKDRSKDEELIVRGKDCCREFMSRFLAAIPLREELEIEKKGPEAASVAAPHQRLQIEFHFMTLSEQSSASSDTEDVDRGTVNMPAATDE